MKLLLLILVLSINCFSYYPAVYECVKITKGKWRGYTGWVQKTGSSCNQCSRYLLDIYSPSGGCVAKEEVDCDALKPCEPGKQIFANTNPRPKKDKKRDKPATQRTPKTSSDWKNRKW